MSYNEIDPFDGEEKVKKCAWCYAECENTFCSDECAKNWVRE